MEKIFEGGKGSHAKPNMPKNQWNDLPSNSHDTLFG